MRAERALHSGTGSIPVPRLNPSLRAANLGAKGLYVDSFMYPEHIQKRQKEVPICGPIRLGYKPHCKQAQEGSRVSETPVTTKALVQPCRCRRCFSKFLNISNPAAAETHVGFQQAEILGVALRSRDLAAPEIDVQAGMVWVLGYVNCTICKDFA